MRQVDPHEERFNMSENYDRSTYLTKVRRVPMRDFDSYAKRNTAQSIKQGGDTMNTDVCKSVSRLSDYQKTDLKSAQMTRLDKSCLKFEGYDSRSFTKSIYNRGQSSHPAYDSTKIINGVKRTTKGTGKSQHVNMKK